MKYSLELNNLEFEEKRKLKNFKELTDFLDPIVVFLRII